MSLSFWLARMSIELDVLRRRAQEFGPALPQALETGVSDAIIFELIRDDASPERFALLISVLRGNLSNGDLTCWIGFSNDPQWCRSFRRHGFPVMEAEIELSSGVLSIEGAAYPERSGSDPVSLGRQHLLTITGVDLDAASELQRGKPRLPGYVQLLTAPDVGLQSQDVAALEVSWQPPRAQVRKSAPGAAVSLEVQASAWPALAEILGMKGTDSVGDMEALRTGRLSEGDGPLEEEAPGGRRPIRTSLGGPPAAPPPPSTDGPARKPRIACLRGSSLFGAPIFRFEEVEAVGFRVTVPAHGMERLRALVERLNFHQKVEGMVSDFRWCLATSTVMIELLHYGKMKSQSPEEPLRASDFMSQHELVVRLLVGKVDNDGSQARDPSMFIPAIFVNNGLSEVVGRETQGMPKERAEFCVNDGKGGLCPLEMSGALARQAAQPLTNVVHIRRPARRGGMPQTLLELSYPDKLALLEDRFERVNLNTMLDDMVFGNSRWRQADFEESEFRRSFARSAMSREVTRLRSIQVAPVDDRDLPETWIHGEIKVRNLKVLFPHGIATLKFSRGPHTADDPWSTLCEIFGKEEISLPSGDWYRLKMAMDLRIRSSLDW